MNTVILNLDTVNLSDEQFYHLCRANQNWKIERTPTGELVIMSPVGGVSGNREADFITDLGLWNRQNKRGKVFSSSTIFRLPNGGNRSPDVAWVSLERWETLTTEQQEQFPPICPDFVLELRSRTDSLEPLQQKMQEYLNSGIKLGWLINPQQQQVEIYRPEQPIEIVQLPARLSGESILPGFELDLEQF